MGIAGSPRFPDVGYLYNNIYTLKSCALVHSTWLPTTRLYLFRSVHLHHRTALRLSRASERLEECMVKNTSLAPLVRELSIYRCTNILASLLGNVQFTHLRTLTLERMSWVRVVTIPLAAEVLGLPFLVEVSFREHLFANEVQFAALFERCRGGVKTLHIAEVAFLGLLNVAVVGGDCTKVWPQAQPHTLSVIGGSARHIVKWLLHPHSPINVSAVKALTYRGRDSKTGRSKFLQALGESLESLEIINSPIENTVMADISPKVLPNLRCLTISGIAPDDPAPLMTCLIRLNAPASRVEEIVLRISCEQRVMQEEEILPPIWMTVDEFMNRMKLPFLGSILVVIEKNLSYREKEKEAIKKSAEGRFQIMLNSGMLNVVV